MFDVIEWLDHRSHELSVRNVHILSDRWEPGFSELIFAERFSCLKAVGKGSYGVVVQAQDALRNKQVAIKKISPVTSHSVDAKHVLREVRLMRHLGVHENIVTLQDLLYREQNDELYIVMELLDSDLHRIIQSSQTLKDEHHRIFMLQLLRGVQFLHENGVIHRDLKPGNLLKSAKEVAAHSVSTADTATAVQHSALMAQALLCRLARAVPGSKLSPGGASGSKDEENMTEH
eukprot:9018-Heterococcus_DN1.PRE.1